MQEKAKPWMSARHDHGLIVESSVGQAQGWLHQAPVVIFLILSYLLLHFALRLNLSPVLGIDDAEQVLFAQTWAPGYRFRQPPLFTWLLLPVVDWLGPGVLAVGVVRYTLLAITYGCLYLTALHWIADRRLAALSVLSFALIYVFAYYAHHDLTHTTALGAMVAASLFVFTKLCRQPTALLYLLLGLCFGLGMLAKWNFVMLAVGLPLTCLMLADYRHLVLNLKSLLTISVMALIVSPTAFWVFGHGQSTGSVSSNILSSVNDLSGFKLMIQGSWALFRSIVLFPLPFLLIFLAVFGPALVRASRSKGRCQTTILDPSFLGWLMLVILGLHAVLIPVFGAVNFTERWMHTALMILPLFLFAILARRPPNDRTISFYLSVITILVAVVVGARVYRYAEGADECGKCREFVPFAALAADLRAAGFDGGTIVADGMHMGGNLKMAFPDSRVIDPAFPLDLWPSRDDLDDDQAGMCLLVWQDDQPNAEARQDLIHRFAQVQLGVPATSIRKSGRVEAMLLRSSSRRYALGFELIRENGGGCR